MEVGDEKEGTVPKGQYRRCGQLHVKDSLVSFHLFLIFHMAEFFPGLYEDFKFAVEFTVLNC